MEAKIIKLEKLKKEAKTLKAFDGFLKNEKLADIVKMLEQAAEADGYKVIK